MVIKKVKLETVVGITSKLPITDKPEVAFAGKSNVGKSSLINALMNRKTLARTSAQPGKTQTINYYNINEVMYCVDLPGYGYANVSEETKAKWGRMIEGYLQKSPMLKQVFLLIDIRHEPSANDKHMYEWVISNGYRPVIVATKLDKIGKSQLVKHTNMIRKGIGMKASDILIPVSSQTKEGIDKLWELIDSYIVGDVDIDAALKDAAREEKIAAKEEAIAMEAMRVERVREAKQKSREATKSVKNNKSKNINNSKRGKKK